MVYRILRIIFLMCLIVGGLIWFGNYYSQKHVSPDTYAISKGSTSVNSEVLQAQQRLAYCSNVLAYAMNYYLLLNEIGTAKALTLQHAWTYGALLYINVNDYDKAIKLGKSVGSQVKVELDRDQSLVPSLVDTCIVDRKKYVDKYKISGMKAPEDGTYYEDFAQYFAKKNQEQLGVD